MLDFSLLIFLQIVSESFPVSSSGHIALAICVLTHYRYVHAAILAVFFSSSMMTFLLHIPTILVVALFFRTTWQPLLLQVSKHYRIVIKLIAYALIADSVTAVWYIIFLWYPISLPLVVGFSCTAGMLLSLRWCSSYASVVRLSHMVALGFIQGIALLPGISRFGTVYVFCRWLGFRATKSFDIAWMLQWPLMVAGALMSGLAILTGSTTFNYSVSVYDIALIVIGTALSLIGLHIAYFCVRAHLMWLISIYMLLPIIVSLLIGC